MRSFVRGAAAVLTAAVLVMSGCGGTESEPAADETAAPETAAVSEVVSMLVTADDLDGEWTVDLYPDAPVQLSESGVVTEEMLEVLPRIEFCESASAEAQAAVDGLRWQAFRQLNLTVDDPAEATEQGAWSGRLIGANEALLAGDPGEVEATFEALTSGLQACGWSTTAGEDGHTATAVPWEDVPEVGDDRVGVLTTIEEPGGGGFVIYEVLVRDGPVLMMETVGEAFIGEGVTPQLTADQAAAIVTTTAAKIG